MNNLPINEGKVLGKLLFTKIELYWDKFQKSLNKVKKKPTPKAVHDLRVSIRRLRALLDIIGEITRAKRGKSYLREMKELIGIFGALRDLHVQYDLINNMSSQKTSFLKPYLKKIEKKISREDGSLQDRIHSVRISQTKALVKHILAWKRLPLRLKKQHRLLAQRNLSCPVVRSLLQQYLLRCFAWFPLVRDEGNQEEFHKLRVQVKRLRYKIEILHPLVRRDFGPAGLVYFRDLQDLMGETHDLDVACRDVERFFSARHPSVLKGEEYKRWQRIMTAKRQTLFRKSWRLLKRLEKYNFFSHR
jgi:CHAD domain-containing protein